MSDIVQLYSDKSKTKKAYPKALASETYMTNGGTVESQLAQIENKNIEQDSRLKDVENKNKIQDVYVRGLFNENKDGRLSVEGEGNSLKLEGSKSGLVEVDKVVGNTFVNIANFSDKEYEFTLNSGQYYNTITLCDLSLIEVNTDYTLLFDIEIVNNTTTWDLGSNTKFVLGQGNSQNAVSGHPVINSISNNGISYNLWNTICYSTNVVKFNLLSLDTTHTKYFAIRPLYNEQLGEGQSITYKVKNLMLFKGDVTLNPPKEYIEGLQSSFESNLVTQEMVEQGLESEENLGKYKVPVKLIGKNKLNLATISRDVLLSVDTGGFFTSDLYNTTDFIRVYKNRPIATNINLGWYYGFYDINKNYVKRIDMPFTPDQDGYVRLSYRKTQENIQLEEGTVVTEFEDYFERTTNVYLNSPLLEGDEIVMHDGELCHYHKYYEGVYDGSSDESLDFYSPTLAVMFKGLKYIKKHYSNVKLVEATWESVNVFAYRLPTDSGVTNISQARAYLQSNPVTIVYELAEPYYESIQADKLLLECANDSTLHIDSIVPVESVKASYTGNIPSVYALEETNNNQDSLIDISLCATDEMYMMIEPLLEVVPQTMSERMVSKNSLGEFYLAMVQRNLKAVDEVPLSFREYVLEKLKNS